MNQNFSSNTLFRFLKKGELARNGLHKDSFMEQLISLENKILEKEFEFSFTHSTNHNFYYCNDISDELVLRKLNDNIKRIYKDKQANRQVIIKQVKTLLNENAEFWLLKTDIKSFYESIDRTKILSKLKNDSLLSYYSLFLLNKIFDNPLLSDRSGLPRGIPTSSTLSEIYMRKFDKWVQSNRGVYYYSRFVDDIVIFFSREQDAKSLFNSINDKLQDLCNLQINIEKTELIEGNTFNVIGRTETQRGNYIEYLGYRFVKQEKNVHTYIASKKVKKIKTRIVKSFLSFIRDSNFDLLHKRIKFLTGNYSISKLQDESVLKAGIFYNYSEIDQYKDLEELNIFFRRLMFSKTRSIGTKLNAKLSSVQRDILKKYCFRAGFNEKVQHNFTYSEMAQIIKCWQ